MHTYFATFSPGFEEFIKKELHKKLEDLQIEFSQESSIVFSTKKAYDKVSKYKFFATTLLLVSPSIQQDSKETAFVKALNTKANYNIAQKHPHNTKLKTFRVMVQKGNQLIGITKQVMDSVKDKIKKQTHLEHSPLKADVEFWFIIRDEKLGYIGLKYIEKQQYVPAKGELRPNIAYMLNVLSEPKDTDTFLDPFAGHGSIPYSRASSFPYAKIYATDNDSHLVSELIKKLSPFKQITHDTQNALQLKIIKDDSIDVIVTDPPWGIYNGSNMNIADFYEDMLKEMRRVIKSDGRVIILTAKKEEMEQAILKTALFSQRKPINTLINGKKATVFRLYPSVKTM